MNLRLLSAQTVYKRWHRPPSNLMDSKPAGTPAKRFIQWEHRWQSTLFPEPGWLLGGHQPGEGRGFVD